MSGEALGRFVADLAEKTAAPGAGSAAAVVVAIAAALAEMAARFSADADVTGRAAALRARTLPLAEEDARAFRAVLDSTGKERPVALSHAADVPLEIAEAAAEVRALASPLLEHGNRNLQGEAVAALALADAAARAAAELVLINLGHESDDPRAARARKLVTRASPPRERPGAEWALGRRVELSGREIAWDVFGDGPPVILLHGTPTWSYLWRKVVPTLARSFSVYVFDLPGYGNSPAPRDREISIRTHASTLVDLLDYWDLRTPAAVGHDIGGAALLRAHLVHGRRFRQLGLVDAVVLAPWITPTTRHIQDHLDAYGTMPRHIFEQITAAHLRTAVHRGLDDDAFSAYHAQWRGEGGQRAYLEKIVHFDEQHTREFEPLLETIRVPVLVLWGQQDAWLDPALARRLGDLIPGADVKLIDGAGHFSPEDAPSEVADALLGFFRSSSGSG